MPQNHQIHEGVLYINNVQPSDAGEYSCLGIGPTGTVLFTATARLVVIGELDSIMIISAVVCSVIVPLALEVSYLCLNKKQ
jgi:hypothetical protein